MNLKLGLLRGDDTRAAFELSQALGWNQTYTDWQRLVDLEPSGCFAARAGEGLVGTVTTTTYGRSLGWVGMMIVHPDFRRRGVGADLMRMALQFMQRLGVPCIKLDATTAGRPLYESLGFVPEADIERWQGVANASCVCEKHAPGSEPPADLFALDQAAYGADRSRLLDRLVTDGIGRPVVFRSGNGIPEGYALAREGRTATYIGPIIGTTSGTVETLIDHMLTRLHGEAVCLDRHTGGHLGPKLLMQRGLSKQRGLTRMRLGPDAGSEMPRLLCASAGPELG